MITGKSGELRLKMLLGVMCACVALGVWNLSVENDLFAVANFALAVFTLFIYKRTRDLVRGETTWRSYR